MIEVEVLSCFIATWAMLIPIYGKVGKQCAKIKALARRVHNLELKELTKNVKSSKF